MLIFHPSVQIPLDEELLWLAMVMHGLEMGNAIHTSDILEAFVTIVKYSQSS